MPKLSVIVPVYQVEKELNTCVESILAQSWGDFELILVDDGSLDRCPQMCDEWARKDSRVRVIHKENGGVSSARNWGLHAAQGKYICFVDADDALEPAAFQTAISRIEESNSDLCIFGATNCYYDAAGAMVKSVPAPENITLEFPGVDISGWVQLFSRANMAAPWNKLYKADIIGENKLGFSENCVMCEDLKFNADYCRFVSRVTCTDQALYRYRLIVGQNQLLKRKFKTPFSNADCVAASLLPYAREYKAKRNNIFYDLAFAMYQLEIQFLLRTSSFSHTRRQIKTVFGTNTQFREIICALDYRKKVKILNLLAKLRGYGIIALLFKRTK